ncbi:AraC family transcriptional regulator [Nocardia tenerifensis]|uniref:AraC family transcriptional regulator n=1 Tax=Nocardia tenerifensis TaxID=228006 RepID=A0A318KAM3_9NOCA|nr:AraC family transcriptional regulator [Nocardia tenerifensis]PXX61752.1 AraC family transcriptional regulator [Nocardia tenerifensis]
MWIRPDHAGYLGPNIPVVDHAAAVDVLNIAVDAPLIFESPGLGTRRVRSVYAPARVPHRVLAPEGRVLLLFADPAGHSASSMGAAMDETVGRFGVGHRAEAEIAAACRAGEPPEMIVRRLAGPAAATVDSRITAVANAIRAYPQRVYRAPELAAELGLSTSHFLRLFARGTGTTFRRYQQWARLRRVVYALASGQDLTRGAVEAGFASPSHFSDTFRNTFGLSATELLHTGVVFDVVGPEFAE